MKEFCQTVSIVILNSIFYRNSTGGAQTKFLKCIYFGLRRDFHDFEIPKPHFINMYLKKKLRTHVRTF